MNIQKVEVEFDKWGQWSHPAIHGLDEKYDEVPYRDIPEFATLEFDCTRVVGGDTDLILRGDDQERPADFRKWQPDPPEGDGWFPFSYSEDEDGPYVLYARTKVGIEG